MTDANKRDAFLQITHLEFVMLEEKEGLGPIRGVFGCRFSPAGDIGYGFLIRQTLNTSFCRQNSMSRFVVLLVGSSFLAWPMVGMGQTEAKDEEPAAVSSTENPYLCPAHWETDRLFEFVNSADEKPRTIRRRDDFVRAIEDAADRVLTSDAKPSWKRMTRIANARTLHYHACWGNDDSEERLRQTVVSLSKLEDKRSQREVQFYDLEKKLMDFGVNENTSNFKVTETILNSAAEFCQQTPMTDRHLRLASNVVRVINTIDSRDADKTKQKELLEQREKQFKRFGDLFASSADLKLSRYGKQLAKPPEESSDLIGQVAEVTGSGLDGEVVDLKDFRGKVVVVDFWATWCPPCVREIPNVLKLYEELNGEGLEVIGVNLDSDLDDVIEFTEERKIPWHNIVGETAQKLSDDFNVRGIPTVMLIDQHGKVVAVKNRIGDLESQIRELLTVDQE